MGYLRRIRLKNFRNFGSIDLTFEEGVSHIIGRNGLGKTNTLEAIHMLSTGRSFRTSNLKEAILHGASNFYIEAEFEKDGINQSLTLAFDGTSRQMQHNATKSGGFTKLLGLLPSVIFSPSDIHLISGTPKERRRFLNLHIAQFDPLYVYYLSRYAKALQQRNAQLRRKSLQGIEVWEEELARDAKYLVETRRKVITTLSKAMKIRYKSLCTTEEKPSIHYLPSISKEISADCWAREREKELVLGHTLVGPHRDDFAIKLDQKSARLYASEGQKRTLIAAIKLAECDDLDDPIVSIDDFGVHLDESRQEMLRDQFGKHRQIFLTSPEPMAMAASSKTIILEDLFTPASR